jgi:MFS family permease
MMNGLQALPQWNTFMGNPAGVRLGWINALYWITLGVGVLIASYGSNKYGRKSMLYLAYVFLIVGVVLQTAAKNQATWIAGRAILGIPGGMFGAAAPILMTEVAYPTQRSFWTSVFFTGFYVGAIIAAWTTFGTRNYTTSWAWRVACILQAATPVVAVPCLILCPESPRWLVAMNRREEARRVLIDHHAGGDENSELVKYELAEIEAAVQLEAGQKEASALDLFRGKGNLYRAFITISLGFFSQWVGNGVVSYYLAEVLKTVGITSVTNQTLISACLQIWNLICAVFGAWAVDRFGRRPLMLSAFVIMFSSYIIITACSGSFANTGAKSVGLAVIPFLFVFFAGYDIGM